MIILPSKKMVTLVSCLILSVLFWSARVSAKNVTFAYNTPTLSGTLPVVVAQDFGFFAAEGLEVKTVFIRGGPTAMAALVGGGVDYTFVAGVAAAMVARVNRAESSRARQIRPIRARAGLYSRTPAAW